MKPVELNQPKKDFTVKKDSWLMKFYMFIRNEGGYNLPTDSCKLRNNMLLSFFLFIFSAPMFLIVKPFSKHFDDELSPWVTFIFTIIGFGIVSMITPNDGAPWVDSLSLSFLHSMGIHGLAALAIGWYVLSTLAIIAMAIFIIIIVGGVILGVKLYESRKPNKKVSVVGKLYSDMRKKVCTPVKYL